MGNCFTVAEEDRNASLSPDDKPSELNDVSSQEQTEKEQKPKSEETKDIPNTTNEQKPRRKNNPLQALTTKKDYTASVNAMKQSEHKSKKSRNLDNDQDVQYEDDGVSIKTKKNGISVNQYGNQRDIDSA